MTTNITPIEALEYIKNKVCETGCRFNDEDCTPENCIIREFKDLATQALAPQECDVDLDYYKNYSKKQLLAEIKLLADEQNQYEKELQEIREQLHSQEKTFTVEEVKGIIKQYIKKSPTPVKSKKIENLYINVGGLLAEFEKETK